MIEIDKLNSLTISELFEDSVIRNPNKIALRYKGETYTYEYLNKAANRFANYLIHECVNEDDIVAVSLERSPYYIISVLGIIKTGASFLPIDIKYPIKRINHILNDSKCKYVITTSDQSDKLIDVTNNLIIIDQNNSMDNFKESNLDKKTSDNQLCYVIYTSGSTGLPKGVLIENKSIKNYLKNCIDFYKLNPSFPTPFFTSISFDLSLTSMLIPIIIGGEIVIFEEEDEIKQLEIFLRENKHFNFIKLTPSHLKLLKSMRLFDGCSGTVIIGGEELKEEDLIDLLKNKRLDIYNEYGPTETTIGATVHKVTTRNQNSVPIGESMNNVKVYILDEHLKKVDDNEIGEICVEGVQVTRGYVNQKENVNSTITSPFDENEKLYRTGDLGKRNKNGLLEYIGRRDAQIKLHGYRIELKEIENIINNHQDILDVQILFEHQQIFAFIKLKNKSKTVNKKEIYNYMESYLTREMLPSKIILVNEFPLTINGKLDRTKLLELIDNDNNEVNKEKAISILFCDLLNINNVSLEDNFFALGGHSLLTIQLISKIKDRFKVELNIIEVFENPTVVELVSIIEKKQKNNSLFEKK